MTDPPFTLRERVERAMALGIARLPGRVPVLLSGQRPVTIDGMTLDPHVQLVRSLRRKRSPHGLCEPTPAEGRARFRRDSLIFSPAPTPVGSVRDFEIDGPGGPLRVRHYAPSADDAPQPVTVYLHGGGFVIGDLETHDEACRILCRDGRVHVLSVDYRLAPEHPFPAALDDARAALRWARAHAAEIGADPARLAIGGDSAGGNLAAVASRLEAAEGQPPFAQLLIYPSADSTTKRRSEELFGVGYFLDTADRRGFNHHYLNGTGVGQDDWRVSPLLAGDFSGLPPALVVTAGFDMLRDEGEAYADALRGAGTTVRTMRMAAHGHGFLHMTGVSPGAHRAMVDVAKAWGEMMESGR